MRCVLINSWYQQYSTGELVYTFRNHLIKQGHSVMTFYGHGNYTNDDGVSFIGNKRSLYLNALLCRITGYEGIYSTRQTKKVIKQIIEYKPDVVYLFNLHAYYLNEYLLLKFLKDSKVKVVYMLFDEYPYLGKCCFAGECIKFKTECCKCPKVHEYPKSLFFDRSNKMFCKKKMLFDDWKYLTLVGVEFLHRQAGESAIARNVKFIPLDMGVNLKDIYYPRNASKLRKELKIPKENTIVLTVGAYSDVRKGINKLIEIANTCLDEPITFINIGYDGDKSQLPCNFIGVSYISDQNLLSMYYSLADIYVMTSSGEAISLACMEALGCGTKIIGFNISGIPYSASKELGTFVPYNDLQAFREAIIKACKKTEESILACREYALLRYDINDYVKKLEKIGKING